MQLRDAQPAKRESGHGEAASGASCSNIQALAVFSISKLAREVGIDQSNLSEMLSGRRDWSKSAIRRLSERFALALKDALNHLHASMRCSAFAIAAKRAKTDFFCSHPMRGRVRIP